MTQNGTHINHFVNQGYYNNTILVHPFDENNLYLDGIDRLFIKTSDDSQNELLSNSKFDGDSKNFLHLITFDESNAANERIELNKNGIEKNIENTFWEEIFSKKLTVFWSLKVTLVVLLKKTILIRTMLTYL